MDGWMIPSGHSFMQEGRKKLLNPANRLTWKRRKKDVVMYHGKKTSKGHLILLLLILKKYSGLGCGTV